MGSPSFGELATAYLTNYPLSKRDSRTWVGEILQKADRVPDGLRNLIVDSAEGNPPESFPLCCSH